MLSAAEHKGGMLAIWPRDSFITVGDTVFIAKDAEKDMTRKNPEGINQSIEAFKKYMDSQSIPYREIDVGFQGGDILVDEKNQKILCSYREPKNEKEKEKYSRYVKTLEQETGYEVIPIEKSGYKADIWSVRGSSSNTLYHLDTFLTQLPNGKILTFPEGMNAASYDRVKKAYGEENIIVIEKGDVNKLIPNAVTVGNSFITSEMPPALRKKLADQGIEVVVDSDLGEDVKTRVINSGPHCLTNELPKSGKILSSSHQQGNDASLDDLPVQNPANNKTSSPLKQQ